MIVRFGHIHYELHKDGTACVSKYEKQLQGDVKIPAHGVYKGKKYRVTSIGVMAFSECNGLTSISIPNSVTTIEDYAFFDCSRLTTIAIPNSVKSIGYRAFGGCERLSFITIPNSVTSIEEETFDGCIGLTSITIPNNVTIIRKGAFEGCTGLTTITIPDSVTCIEAGVFEGCIGLINIQVSKDNPTYDSRNNCNAIIQTATNSLISGCCTTIIPDSLTSIEDSAFCGCTRLTEIIIPNGIKNIGWSAFKGCKGLTTITIPDGIKDIDGQVFSGCIGLTSISIPNSVTEIGYEAFSGCTRITKIQVAPDNPTYDSRENCNAIIETATNTLITGCCTTIIPDSVTNIGWSAFSGCTGLTSIIIPNSVKCIESGAFKSCTGLSSISIPNSVTYIGELAFSDCIRLSAITIPNSVTSIEDYTFSGCTELSAITIPNSVKRIGKGAFSDCIGLIAITMPNNIMSIEVVVFEDSKVQVFNGCENLQIIRVPKGKKEDYCKLGLEPYRELIQEPQEEEYTILLNIARGYEKGIGMAKNLAQAVLCYVQAADKGCNEAAFHLGELYETGNGLPQDLRQAAEWYAKATSLYHPTAENKRRACLQKLEQEEQRMEAYQHEQAQERAHQVAERAKAKYLFFDTETNGLPYNYKAGIENTSNWPRLLQIGWIMTDERGNVLKSCTKWIFPNGFSVDSEVTKLTGITTDKLLFEGERISSVLSDFLQDIESAEILVGHNVEYDIMVVGCELYRNGQPMQGQALTRHPHICTMKKTVDFCAIPSTNSYYSGYKYPKLTELYTKLFGHAFSGAHDAMADIKATKECFFELKRRGIL